MASTTYATVEELRGRAGIKNDIQPDTSDDPLLQSLLNSAARMVDKHVKRGVEGTEVFSATSSATRYFDDDLTQDGLLVIDDALTVTALTRGGTTITSDYYQLYPYNPGTGPYTHIQLKLSSIHPYTTNPYGYWYEYPVAGVGVKQIAVTGTWGYCTQANRPPEIKEATLLLAQQLYWDTHASRKDVAELAGLAMGDPGRFVDKRVAALLAPYVRQPNYNPRVRRSDCD